ncbi:pirin family protein [Sphingomonas sp. JC676]|uniref:pirin family protein n=1 Tax=Sphingomonas sp. JC676 TaxID=2768065 RepID=UPI001657E202|nr:pirin family protein [Sphingomonas sp. JC676]MBC9033046.1 pirin family protein [Sphingomonas sp. JC676]
MAHSFADAAASPVDTAARKIMHRTRGRRHGPITRLMSPSDLGELLKPFVFLDLIEHEGQAFEGSLHPHSGIATLTYIGEGRITYIDPDNFTGQLPAGGVEWMQAGGGMWHGGGVEAGRTRGFQLWIALPPELELGPTHSLYQAPEDVALARPARVLLGKHGGVESPIAAPSPITYLAVTLRAGERWRFEPPAGQTVLWTAIAKGRVAVPERLEHGDMAVFERSETGVEFEAIEDAEFMVGAAAPHEHDLALGYYSVHTSRDALRAGEARISEIQKELIAEGRL